MLQSIQIGYMADVFVVGMARTDFAYITADIGPSPNNYAWLLVSINLAGSVLTPVVGRLSDIFERKIFLLVGNLIGFVGCVVSATCHSMGALIGAGVLIGLSSAAHSLSLTCIAEMVPKRSRPLANGLFQGSLIAASAFSPLIAHAFVLHTTWRDIYWMAFAHNIAGFIGVFIFYNPEKRKTQLQLESIGTRFKKFDWYGPVLYVVMLTLIAIGLLFGGSAYPWISAGVLTPTFLGVALIFVFAIWEAIHCPSPWAFLPKPLVKEWRTFDTILFALFLSGIGDATTILWSEEVQILYTQKSIPQGLYGMAHGLAGPVFAPLVGYLVQKGYARWWLTFFIIGFTIVGGAQATLSTTSQASSTALVALSGAFYTAISVTAIGMIQVVVRHEYLGVATGIAQSLHTYGGAMTSIIAPVMLKNKLTDQVKSRLVPALAEAGVPLLNLQVAVESFLAGDVTSPAFAGANPLGLLKAGQVLKSCYVHAFAYVYEICITFGAVSIIFALFSKNLKEYMSPVVEIRLKKSKGLLPPDVEALTHRVKSRGNRKAESEGSVAASNSGL
ncbi:trichothecene efflux pump [Mytilinidion resinicola]|uniref:Trichothecene efflux pump n=1 Tax=Mytilinidion resinicola TaxID=574789 RepID=A0A6A6Z2P9_9PEZI|nr:trichothecene efflux pump [Mytilinidion resinicola]KAF2815280.1 trichothecene efflux pump [Mytilinidion resinicola]